MAPPPREYYDQPYELADVLATLRPTPQGIRLADIQDTLTVHGLECQVRRDVDSVRLEATVRNGYLAILPIRLRQGSDHYVIVAPDSTGAPAYIDPPFRVRPLAEIDLNSHQKHHDRLVLFVRALTAPQRAAPKTQASQISTSLDRVDLGSFPMTGPNAEKPLSADFTLSNPSSAPLLVTQVTASCGCTGVNWTGGLLHAKSEQKVSVSTHPVAWGKGMPRRSVTFRFLDGSERSVEIIGEGQTPEQVQQVRINTTSVRFEVGQADRQSRQPPIQTISVTGPFAQLDLLQVVSSDQWLNIQATKNSAEVRTLEIGIMLDDAVLEAIAKDPSGVKGGLRASTTSPDNPVNISVVVVCKDFFTMGRSFVELEPGTEAAEAVVFSPVQGEATKLAIDDLSCGTAQISFENTSRNGTATLKVRAGAEAPTGLHPVRCQVKSDFGSERVAEFVVRVRKATNATNTRYTSHGHE